MTATSHTRRSLLAGLTGLLAASVTRASTASAPARIVVIGGGFGGASCARTLKSLSPDLDVTLVEANPTYVAGPLSNAVIAGWRDIARQSFGYDALARTGVRIVIATVTGIEASARIVTCQDGSRLPYDRLVLAPGIDIRFDALPGYTEAAAALLPHAWKPGAQTLLLRQQLDAMPDGGTVLISAPMTPYRCPPAPYERASLIAQYLKTRKPKSKLILLDAKDTFSQQKQFEEGWARLYPGLIERVPLSGGGRVTEVDAGSRTVMTEFDTFKGDVVNIIAPQMAGRLAALAGVTDASGWCPVQPTSFESTRAPGIHVIGDACLLGALPKSGLGAHSQGLIAAAAIIRLLADQPPLTDDVTNACYSMIASDYVIAAGGSFRVNGDIYTEIEGKTVTSPLGAPLDFHATEARKAVQWFDDITAKIFG